MVESHAGQPVAEDRQTHDAATNHRARILCVDDDAQILTLVATTLRRAGHEPIEAANAGEALHRVAQGGVDVIISDFQMPGITGLELLRMLRQDGHEMPLIMLTGHASIEHAVESIQAGATDYLAKPFQREQLDLAVERALEVARLRRENLKLRREIAEHREDRRLLGDSEAMRRVDAFIESAARTRATVLLYGESGTGKELVARAIHARSDRRTAPFVTLNCAALPAGLIESALFGHERGAFTGALKRVAGAFERAQQGTLLLDEISEMRVDLQAKFLRVLQEQEFERIGGQMVLKADVRIIATSNKDVAAEVAAGRFRQDLFYRLNVLSIELPPLRTHREDIPLLATHFAARAAATAGKEIEGFAPAALDLLMRYDWPGNVRELEHSVERAVILASERQLQPYLFRDPGASSDGSQGPREPEPVPPPGADADGPIIALSSFSIAEAENILIQRALAAADNNRTKAAELLGISDRTLRKKLNLPG